MRLVGELFRMVIAVTIIWLLVFGIITCGKRMRGDPWNQVLSGRRNDDGE